jgi:hypothetical protein
MGAVGVLQEEGSEGWMAGIAWTVCDVATGEALLWLERRGGRQERLDAELGPGVMEDGLCIYFGKIA